MPGIEPDGGGRDRRTALVLAGGLLGLLAAGYLLAYVLAGDGVPRGTVVRGVDIGGLSRAAAAGRLDATVGERVAEPIAVTAGGDRALVDPADAGLGLDSAATVATAGGRSWSPSRLLHAYLHGQVLDPVMRADQARLDAAVESLGRELDRRPRDGSISFRATTAVARPAIEGRELDRAAGAQLLRDAVLASRDQPVELPLRTLVPAVTQAEVDRAMRDLARPALAEAVTVVAAGRPAELEPRAIAPALSMVPDAQGRLALVVDGAVLVRALRPLLPGLQAPARDAAVRVVRGRPVVVPAVTGKDVDPGDLAAAVRAVLPRREGRVARVASRVSRPRLTTAAVRALKITERLSSYRQEFPYAPYRVTNIGRAARYIDGTLLAPGQVFSMNDTVHERTAANGYVVGTVIQDGRFREELGGGVSTITTATWNAAFYAGLQRIEQRAHSFWISRYPAGLEATVAYGVLDLRFRNDSPYGVLVTAQTTNSSVTITMWGTRRYAISAAFGPRRNVTPFEHVDDDKPGCLPQPGVEGFDITVARTLSKGRTVVRRESFATHYKPSAEVSCRPPPVKPAPSR